MNRRSFLGSLLVVPAALAIKIVAEKPEPERTIKGIDLPPAAGKVLNVISYQDRIVIACENAVLFTDPATTKEPTVRGGSMMWRMAL